MADAPSFALARSGLFLLACSQRADGNTDTAARIFSDSFGRAYAEAAAGFAPGSPAQPPVASADVVLLRRHRVTPCRACDLCLDAAGKLARDKEASAPGPLFERWLKDNRPKGRRAGPEDLPFGCPLALEDQSAPLLRAMAAAPALCIVSPVYFYHLPALLKALLDRAQSFWALREAGLDMFPGRPRPCYVILAGARKKGAKLFDGSLLTLKYALHSLNIALVDPLLLYGLDAPGDLDARGDLRELVACYGADAGRAVAAANASGEGCHG